MTFLVLLRRELRRLVLLPQSYGIAAAFLVISGVFFVNTVISTSAPDLAVYYANIAGTIVVLAPIVAMRSFAEERVSGALDLTLSWPVSRLGLVLAKFVVNTLFAWLLVSVALLYVRLLSQLSGLDVARASGGYLGMLFLCAAFSALALMVSAWAATPTSAAFLGFGLLLFLWSLQYAPGWIYWLNQFGPSKHLTQMSQGVVYLSDAAYFIIVAVVGVGLAHYALNRAKPGPKRRQLVRTAAAVGAAAFVLLAMPTIVSRVHGEVDLTGNQRNTISQTTRDVVRRLKAPIVITGYVQALSAQHVQLANVVKEYRAAGAHINLREIDPDTQPGLAEEAGVTTYNQYKIQIGSRSEILPDVQEIDLTTAISQLSREHQPLACFTIGHGERAFDDSGQDGLTALANQLKVTGFRSLGLALGAPGGETRLQGCDVVLVVGPQAGFLPGELALLSGYLRDNGRLVVAPDGYGVPIGQLNEVIGAWGVNFRDGIVHDNSSLADDTASVVSSDYQSQSPVTGNLAGNGIPVVMPASLSIDKTAAAFSAGSANGSGAYVTTLISSSSKSWTVGSSGATVGKGPFVLAATSDSTHVSGSGAQAKESGARIGLIGSADLASNRFASVMGNHDLVTAIVQWTSMQNDLITANRDPGAGYKLVLTAAQKSKLIQQGVVLPALAVLVFLPLTLVRLKRG